MGNSTSETQSNYEESILEIERSIKEAEEKLSKFKKAKLARDVHERNGELAEMAIFKSTRDNLTRTITDFHTLMKTQELECFSFAVQYFPTLDRQSDYLEIVLAVGDERHVFAVEKRSNYANLNDVITDSVLELFRKVVD